MYEEDRIVKAVYGGMTILLDDPRDPSLNNVRVSQMGQSALEFIVNGPFSRSTDPVLRRFAKACQKQSEINQRVQLTPASVAANLFRATVIDHIAHVATSVDEWKQMHSWFTRLYLFNQASKEEIGVFCVNQQTLVFKINEGGITVDIRNNSDVSPVATGYSVKEVWKQMDSR